MGNKQKKSSGGKKKKRAQNSVVDPDAAGSIGGNGYGLMMIDPAICRFQHSKIRPYFSGCGRSVQQTLDDIKDGKTNISDLPPIQVLVGDETANGPCYFGLNNRRLWVFKRLREEGYLEQYGNKVAVRVRRPKSQQEKERYTLANCVLEARLMPEKKKKQTQKEDQSEETQSIAIDDDFVETNDEHSDGGVDPSQSSIDNDSKDEDEDYNDRGVDNNDSDDDKDGIATRNRFAHMMIDDSSSSEDDES